MLGILYPPMSRYPLAGNRMLKMNVLAAPKVFRFHFYSISSEWLKMKALKVNVYICTTDYSAYNFGHRDDMFYVNCETDE